MLSNDNISTKLAQGAVAVIPTDTVYGVVCSAANQAAVERLYQLKSRENKPGTLVAASIAQLVELGIPRRYLVAVEQYWPGAISIIIPMGLKLGYLHQGKGSLAIRIPGDESFQKLLAQSGPLMTSSANMPGEKPATTIDEAKQYFGDTVDCYVDGGDLSGREPSTIIKIIDDAVEVVRHGAVHIKESGEIDDAV
jgi:tRNA threonylcarbamoyl adenosine modification protein (Sua5/YciO/YrdC/YwlC family)